MNGHSTGIYRTQRAYFARAYETGRHGWPTVGVSPMVSRFLRSAKGRGHRALDIGCGEGRHSAAFAQSGFLTVGVDLEPKALARARAALNDAAAGPRFLQANVFALPFSASAFDVVVDYGCLHHVRRPDTARYLDQVVPLLKPGGYYLLSCFSTKFKHHPGERRTRDWLVHAGHYDRFFRRADFPAIFGRWFDIVDLTEDREGLYVFHNVLMRKRVTTNGSRRVAMMRQRKRRRDLPHHTSQYRACSGKRQMQGGGRPLRAERTGSYVSTQGRPTTPQMAFAAPPARALRGDHHSRPRRAQGHGQARLAGSA